MHHNPQPQKEMTQKPTKMSKIKEYNISKIEKKIIQAIDDLDYDWERFTELEKIRHIREAFYPLILQDRQDLIGKIEKECILNIANSFERVGFRITALQVREDWDTLKSKLLSTLKSRETKKGSKQA
jgi:hypothetical protein